MPRLFAALIRHAEYRQLPDTPSAHQPFPLNEKGISQATQAGKQLIQFSTSENLQIKTTADSSNLLRAWQTTQIIKQQIAQLAALDLNIECINELAERGLGSCMANLSIVQIEEIMREDPRFSMPPADWKSNSRYCLPYPGAESLLNAGERVARHLTQTMELLAQSASIDSLKIFVGHGAAFRHAAYHLGVLQYDEIARLSMFHAQPVYLEYMGENKWLHRAGEWKVRSHLVQAMD